MNFLFAPSKLGVFFTLRAGVVQKGVWFGVRAHACADCAQLQVDLFFAGFEVAIVKKGPGFAQFMHELAKHADSQE